jgi:hypothetical protein
MSLRWKGNVDLKDNLVPIGDLILDPDNARGHPQRNIDAIRSSLEQFGQVKPCVVHAFEQATQWTVIAGNGLVEAAREMGFQLIAVSRFEGTDDEARAFALADNRTGELSEWDLPTLAVQLSYIHEETDIALPSLGWEKFEYAPLLDSHFTPRDDGDDHEDDDAAVVRIVLSREQWITCLEAVNELRQEGDLTDGEALTEICRRWKSAQ